MSRNMQGGNRSRMGMSDNRGPRNFGSAKLRGHGGPGVLGSGPASLLSQNLGGGYGMGGGLGGRDGGGGGGYEMDSLLQQRSLQQQLSLRESQLALANSLLQQQQQQTQLMGDSPRLGVQGIGSLGMGPVGGLGGLGGLGGGPGMMSKRHLEMPSDFQPFMKRPRTDLSLSQPRDRYRNRGNDVGNRGSNVRRNQTSSASSSRPYRGSDRDSSARGRKDSFTEEKYDPENPTGDDEEKKEGEGKGKSDKYHCYVCNLNCRDDDGFSRHMNSKRHKDCMLSVLSIHEEKSSQIKSQMVSRIKAEKHLRNLEDEEKKRKSRGFCKVCDISLEIFYDEHVRTVFHKKRALQVNKGCGWCGVPNFVNFSAVLAHRETEEHKKNQEVHEGPSKDNKGRRYSDSRHERKTETKSQEKRKSPVKVNMPESLAKFNPDVAVGQTCVVAVSGWFCKLCNKFYNNEAAAKDTHCKTEPHFGKYKRFIYAKLKAKAEAQQAAAEKAAEEEENKKKDGEDKEGENGTGEKEPNESMEGEEKTGDCSGDGGASKDEAAEEEEMQDESAMLAVDADGNLDLMEDDDVDTENRLLNEMENSAYQTAEDETLGVESGADTMEGEDLSLEVGDNTRQLLDNELQESPGPDDSSHADDDN